MVPGSRLDRQDLLAFAELPLVRALVGGVPEIDAGMAHDLGGMGRPPMRGDVGRRGDSQNAGLDELCRDKAAGWRFTEAKRQVKAVRDKVSDRISHDELDSEIAMGVEKAADGVGERHTRKECVHVHAQPPSHRAARSRRLDRGLLEAIEMRADLLVKSPALIGKPHGARGAVEQADADPSLETRDRAADA